MTREEFAAMIDKAVAEASGKSAAGIIDAVNKRLLETLGTPMGDEPWNPTPGAQIAAHPAVREYAKGGIKNSAAFPVVLPGYGLAPGTSFAPMVRGGGVATYLPESIKGLAGIIDKDGKVVQKAGEVTATMFPSQRTYGPLVPFPQRRARVRDLLGVTGINTPQLEYARVTGYSNTALGTAELGTKPQATISTTNIVESAKLIAVFMPVTKQALQDVPALQTYINSVLEYFLGLTEDADILGGGGGNAMLGILNTAGIQTRPKATDEYLDAIRKGITDLEVAFTDAGFNATGMVMHPRTWELLELLKTGLSGDKRYLLQTGVSTPAQGAPRSLWGVPVVVTPAIAQGFALIGAWDIGAHLFTYQGVETAVTDSHSDWFTKNLLAVRVEFRELLTVYFPKAFVNVTGLT